MRFRRRSQRDVELEMRAHIDLETDCRDAQRVGDLLGGAAGEIPHRNRSARLGEIFGARLADARRAAGDDDSAGDGLLHAPAPSPLKA